MEKTAPNTPNKPTSCISEMRRIFNMYADCGKLSLTKLGECLRAWGQNPSEAMLQYVQQDYIRICKTTRTVSGIGTGQCNPSELRLTFEHALRMYQIVAIRDVTLTNVNVSVLLSNLQKYEDNPSEYVSMATLRHVLTTIGEKFTDDEWTQLCTEIGVDNDAANCEHFVRQLLCPNHGQRMPAGNSPAVDAATSGANKNLERIREFKRFREIDAYLLNKMCRPNPKTN